MGAPRFECPRFESTGGKYLALTLLLPLLLGIQGCGYRAGLAPDLAPGRPTETIGIEIFGNESLVPNLERSLHARLSDAARRHTSLELVAPRAADLVVRGEILGFRRDPGSRTVDNRVVETRDIVTVEASLVDRARGNVVGRTRTRIGYGSAIDVPGREPAAVDNALRNSADRILLTLLAGLKHGVNRPDPSGGAAPSEPSDRPLPTNPALPAIPNDPSGDRG